MSATVVVYNLGGKEALNRVSLTHAIKMVHQGKARILASIKGEMFGPYERPTAVELVRYVFAKWKYNRTGVIPFSKRGILRRDSFTCAYCGGKATTVDHIKPKSKGNPASWENSIAACQPCNNAKGSDPLGVARFPSTNGKPGKLMTLAFQPYRPTFEEAYRWSHPEADWL
ncbi:HNH endonuclease [Microbacterium phage Zooman]|nr:HNH endonuclease [Microbacterium phage Zooman]